MAVFRIEKTRDYTVMSNHHLRDMSLSLKAKGLLSLMLSLPENWDYTMKGLARICKDGIDSISGGIRELEEHGYLIRERVRGANGQLGSIEYTILEQPKEPTPAQEKPIRENPVQANPTLVTPVQEEPAQLNKEESSNYPSRTDLSSTELSNPIRSNPPTPVGARMGTDRMGARECYREEYLDEVAFNSQSNVYFGYTLAELDEVFQGTRYIFTLGDDGNTTVRELQAIDDPQAPPGYIPAPHIPSLSESPSGRFCPDGSRNYCPRTTVHRLVLAAVQLPAG